jgi:hypothetical protein
MKDLIKRNYQGDLMQAVVRSLGQLARNAHRTGNLRHRRSHRRYPVFTAGLNGREYEIITSPVGSTQNAIISVSAEREPISQEFETRPRSLSIESLEVAWHDPFTIERLMLTETGVKAAKQKPPAQLKFPRESGGVYILEKNGNPIYVGETHIFGERWGERFNTLREMAVSTSPYRVRIGIIKPELDERLSTNSGRRGRIESVLIRELRNKNINLTNVRKIRPFRVLRPATITNSGNRPSYVHATIPFTAGQIFEL